MKNRRFKHKFSSNASSLHKKIGTALRDSSFGYYEIYQEYPVNKINPEWGNGRAKFDWVIKDLKVVIEGHGIQHYKPQTFGGGCSRIKSLSLLKERQAMDALKKESAQEAGWTYICIPYTEEKLIDTNYVEELITAAISDQVTGEDVYLREFQEGRSEPSVFQQQYQLKKEYLEESGIAEQRRQKAREYRKKKYKELKARKKSRENHRHAGETSNSPYKKV